MKLKEKNGGQQFYRDALSSTTHLGGILLRKWLQNEVNVAEMMGKKRYLQFAFILKHFISCYYSGQGPAGRTLWHTEIRVLCGAGGSSGRGPHTPFQSHYCTAGKPFPIKMVLSSKRVWFWGQNKRSITLHIQGTDQKFTKFKFVKSRIYINLRFSI